MEDNVKRTGGKPHSGEKYLQKAYLIKDLSIIYKEFSKLNNKKTNSLIKKWAKCQTHTSGKKHTYDNNNKKNSFYTHAIKEIQMKETRDSTTHLLEWPKSKTLTAKKAGKDMKSGNSFTPGNAEWHSHSERQSGVFYKTINILLSCDPTIMLLGIYPMSRKLIFTQKPAYRRLLTTAKT